MKRSTFIKILAGLPFTKPALDKLGPKRPYKPKKYYAKKKDCLRRQGLAKTIPTHFLNTYQQAWEQALQSYKNDTILDVYRG